MLGWQKNERGECTDTVAGKVSSLVAVNTREPPNFTGVCSKWFNPKQGTLLPDHLPKKIKFTAQEQLYNAIQF